MFVKSQRNREGKTLKPTQKSATASETINALVFVRRFRLLQTRKIVNPFPVIARNERTQPRIENQVSIFTAVASMRRTEALASVKFYQILSIFIFFIRLIILEDFIRLISHNGPCVRLGCSFFLATALILAVKGSSS